MSKILINKVKKNNINDLTIDELVHILNYADKMYYQEGKEPILSDNIYDFLRERLKQLDPKHDYFSKIGYEASTHLKVSLPFWMGSMDKVKADDVLLSKWSSKFKGPYLVSEKLDGISILISIIHQKDIQIFTRGNGSIGRDVSYIQELFDFDNIVFQMKKKNIESIYVRGELIMSKDNFKYYSQFNKARNMISGLIHRKDKEYLIEYKEKVDFVAFEVLEPRYCISDQYKLLTSLNFTIPLFCYIEDINSKELSNILIKFRNQSKYEIDGIIIVDDHYYDINKDKNPNYAFAFKMLNNDEIAETTVKNVEWNMSKDGYLIPRIIIEPVILSGSIIHKMSGKHAKFIERNKIGIGTVLQITLDGGVIPGVLKVLQSSETALMPYNINGGEIVWDDTHTHLKYLEKGDKEDIRIKELTHFFKTIKTDNMDIGIIKKLYNYGFKRIQDIIHITKEDLLKIDGFKDKLADKLILHIQESIKRMTLSQCMEGSNIFSRGLGQKKLYSIIHTYPNILSNTLEDKQLIQDLIKIDGISDKIASLFVKDIKQFKIFMEEIGLNIRHTKQEENILFKDKKIVITGFRDNYVMEFITSNGGNIISNVSKNTSFLIYADNNKNTHKLNKAIELNIPIFTLNDFIKKYNLYKTI